MAVKPLDNFKLNNVRHFVSWRLSLPPRPLLTVVLALVTLVAVLDATHLAREFFAPPRTAPEVLAPLFTPEVTFWEPQILAWSQIHNVEPNLLATIMQIESCGHPTVNSPAGAQGLFQVMPFHFASTENMLDPDTNALRGANFIKECLNWSNGDVGLAMACYNGGPRVIQMNSANWYQEVKSYYHWGTGIYADALSNKNSSDTLTRWLNAGGDRLCRQAAAQIGLQ
jgi:soluble lytic murein transglycosylase-like protein